MNVKEHLLTTLSEECAEVQQAASKALRFGPQDIGPETTKTNAENIEKEFIEAMVVRDMLREMGVLKYPDKFMSIYLAKRERVEQFVEYAKSKGTIK